MTTARIESSEDFESLVRREGYEFLDFGCSRGGSIEHAKAVFEARGDGLGIDIDPRKVEEARARGHHAIDFDILAIPDLPLVRFVTLIHFLEHTAGHAQARAFLEKACAVATDFVYVAQPFFDADGLLLSRGFKLYWSDWRGHRNPMSVLALHRILRDLLDAGTISRFSILLRTPIRNSGASEILPLVAGEDQPAYEPRSHPAKDGSVEFDFPVFREVRALASRREEIHEGLLARVKKDHLLVDARPRLPPVVRAVRW